MTAAWTCALLLTGGQLVGAAVLVRRRPPGLVGLLHAALLVGLAGAWLEADAAAEGFVIVELAHGNGLVLADLLALPALAVAAALLVRWWRQG